MNRPEPMVKEGSSPPGSPGPGVSRANRQFADPRSIALTALCLFAVISGIALFLGYRQFEAVRQGALSHDRTTANLLADLIRERNRATIAILQSYGARPLFISGVKKRQAAELQRHLSELSKKAEIDLLFVTDPRGILWANFPVFPEAIGRNLSDRDWYRGTSARWKPYISGVFQLIVGNRPLAAAFCVPIFDEKEKVIGILATSQRLGFLLDAIQRVPLIPDTAVTVIDRAGQMLYSNRFSYRETIAQHRLFPKIDAALHENKQQIEISDPGQEAGKSYLTVVPVGETGWSVIVERSRKEIYRSGVTRFVETAALSLLLFLLAFGYLLYQRSASRLTEAERRLQTEMRLRRSEQRYRAMFETMISGFALLSMIYDEEGNPVDCRYEEVNPAHERLTGLKRGEILGRTVRESIPGLESYWIENYGRVDRTGEPLELEHRVEGLQRLYRVCAHRPEPGYVAVTFEDITEATQAKEALRAARDELERRVAERTEELLRVNEELRKSEQNYKSLFQNASIGIFHSLPEGRFLRVNPVLAAMFGYGSPEEMVAAITDIDTQIYVDSTKRPEILSNTLRSPGWIYAENRYRRRDGTMLTANLSVRKVHNPDGTVAYLEGFVEEITERKRAEEERKGLEERLLRAEKMEALGTLAGGVAHDLNNMLGALIGHAELLKWDLKKTDPLYDAAENIFTSGQAAAAVVQDLLTMARRGVILKEPASLNRIVAERIASSEIRKLLDAHPHVALKTQYDPDLLEVNLSAIHIERVVTNLISNALHSLQGAEGTVTIKTENRYLEAPWTGYETIPKGEYALLCLSDTGIGIGPEHMKNLFEPYFMRKTLKKGGSGLGLSVIWGAVKDHDGYIDVASTPGRGSAFTLYFPVTRDGAAGRVGHPADPYRGRGERILVVDDEEAQCRIAEKILTRLNYAVKSVESGEEALGYLADHDVDLIVLDMIMAPGIDGYETYRRVLEIKPRQKAILFSGFSKTERVKMAQELGAGEFIMKPYLIERLGIAVKRELERRS